MDGGDRRAWIPIDGWQNLLLMLDEFAALGRLDFLREPDAF